MLKDGKMEIGRRGGIWRSYTEAKSKEKHGVWDPMPELTVTSHNVHCLTPMRESTLSPSRGLFDLASVQFSDS